MKTKFNETDTIHFMDDNKPKSGEVTGITIRTGKGEGLNDKFDVKEGETEITYSIKGHWYGIKEENAHASILSLQKAVFAPAEIK